MSQFSANPEHPKYDGVYNRVQDKELLEISDLRSCMSMHQPWASLLVAGIKKHEGRPWYTSHRGRLWIASTAKPVDVEEVRQMEQFYRAYYNGKKALVFTDVFVWFRHVNNFLFPQMIQLNFPFNTHRDVYWDVFWSKIVYHKRSTVNNFQPASRKVRSYSFVRKHRSFLFVFPSRECIRSVSKPPNRPQKEN